MVQRKLLTAHPGSVHDGGEAPGGRSSLPQGAGKRSAGAPDLGSAVAAEQRRDREKGFSPRKFHVTSILPLSGVPSGVQAAPWRGPTLGRAGPLAPLWLFQKLLVS